MRRRGFTLVELLVVIAIIGVLVGLLLPAVQAAREAARRSQSVSNGKNIGLAICSHHDAQGKFPGNWEDPGRGTMRASFNFWILPFLESQSIFDIASTTTTGYAHDVAAVRSAKIPAFLDPRDSTYSQKSGLATGDWSASNYANSHQVFGAPGVSWNSKCEISTIRDGTSKTISLAQKLGRCGNNGSLWAHGAWNAPWMSVFYTNNASGALPPQDNPDQPSCNPDRTVAINGVMVTGFLDGSVRLLTPSVDPTVWLALVDPRDGKVVNMDSAF